MEFGYFWRHHRICNHKFKIGVYLVAINVSKALISLDLPGFLKLCKKETLQVLDGVTEHKLNIQHGQIDTVYVNTG